MYKIAKANKWLCSDAVAKKRLKEGRWMIIARYGKNENFLVYQPYLPLIITK